MKRQYVVGFMFTDDTLQVLLIRKTHPRWQAGFLNGIGGHVETGEFPPEALRREFYEETGEKSEAEWTHTCTYEGSDYVVYFMRAFDSKTIEKVMARDSFPTDETPELWPTSVDSEQLVAACSWAIPLSCATNGVMFPVQIYDLVPQAYRESIR
jgi:8-oxo-dGTP pyrophosphatase MutT (NUDIX family)